MKGTSAGCGAGEAGRVMRTLRTAGGMQASQRKGFASDTRVRAGRWTRRWGEHLYTLA